MQIEQGFNRYNTVSSSYYVRAAVDFTNLQRSTFLVFKDFRVSKSSLPSAEHDPDGSDPPGQSCSPQSDPPPQP